MSDPIVELRDVFCVHRTAEGDAAALQGMTMSLAHDEVLCVLGPSGAGKSTLLRVIAGLEVPSAGIVRVLGCDVGRRSARWRARFRNEQIGFLSQHSESALPPDLPVGQAVGLPLALRGIGGHARRERVEELLECAGLGDCAPALPGELSGGERQRVALCAAVAHRPALLLADEPTGELDEASAQAVRALIVELGTSVVIASHDPDTAIVAERAVRIRDGRVVEDHRDGESALVVGRGGWLRLPSHLLTQARIADRARVRPAEGGLLVTPASGSAEPAPATSAPLESSPSRGVWRPVGVELRRISRGHGRGRSRREVIVDVTRSFTAGRLTVVTGRSGAGKTTLLRLLVGLDPPDRGELTIDGVSIGDVGAE
jgi:ABC-type lipoprotein export system ATPase subunit